METAKLETGNYYLSTVSYASYPPVSRPLGAGKNSNEIVVLPLGTPPPEWLLIKGSGDIFAVTIEDKNARNVDDSLQLINLLPPFLWRIIRGAPSPPPIGEDSFGIVLPNEPQGWFIPSTEGDQAVEVPVSIGLIASSIHIVPSRQGIS